MNNWEKIKQNPEKLKNMVNELGTRETGERFNVSKCTVNDWLKKFGFKYNFDSQKWEKDGEVEKEQEEMGKFEKYLNEISTRNIDIQLKEDTYIIRKDDEKVEVDKDRLEDLYYNYCELNLSQEETALNNDMIKDDFKLIKSAFDIIHDSLPLTDEEILNNSAEDNIKKILKNKKRKIKEKKPIEELRYLRNIAEKYYEKHYFADKIIEEIDIVKLDYTPPNIHLDKRDMDMLVTLADLHTGKEVLSSKVIGVERDFNKDTLKDRMNTYRDRIVDRIKLFKPEKLYITSMGDIADNPLSNTYPNQIYHQDLTGEEQILECADIIAEFIMDIRHYHDDIKYTALPGNHTDSRMNVDILISGIVEKMLSNQDIEFDVVNQMYKVQKIRDNNFIFAHGEHIRNGTNTQENDILNIIYALGLKNGNNYVITAHKHHEEANEGVNYEHIKLPSIVGSDGYSANQLNVSVKRPAQMYFTIDSGETGKFKVYFD